MRKRKRKILILKTTLALFFASFLFNVDAFALDCQIIFSGSIVDSNRSIYLTFPSHEANSTFNIQLGFYYNNGIFYPMGAAVMTNPQQIIETTPNCRYAIPFDGNTAFDGVRTLFSDQMKKQIAPFLIGSPYEDVIIRVSRSNNPNDYKDGVLDTRVLYFSISSIDDKPKLDYVMRTCFNADRITNVFLASYQRNFQWYPTPNSLVDLSNVYPGWEFSVKWLDENQNLISGASNNSKVVYGRPTNKYTYCEFKAENNNVSPSVSYIQKLRVNPYQAPAIYTEYPQKNMVGSFTAQIKCTTENDPYNTYPYDISCSQTYPVIHGSNAVSGTVSGNTVTYTKSGLAAGRYEFFIFTEFKKCENRINYVINPNGTSTIYEDTWYYKATFEIENSSSEEIKIFGLSLSENVHTLKEINIFNTAGQIVKNIPLNFEIDGEKWSEFKIDVDNLIKGAYLFSFVGADGYSVGEAKFMRN